MKTGRQKKGREKISVTTSNKAMLCKKKQVIISWELMKKNGLLDKMPVFPYFDDFSVVSTPKHDFLKYFT